MILWGLLLIMITIINVTMAGAIMSLFGNVPDKSFAKIMSQWLRKRGEPQGALFSPTELARRLGAVYDAGIRACAGLAIPAIGVSLWTVAAGWGPVAMTAITFWILAGNALFSSVAPASWRRRMRRIPPDIYEREDEKSQPPDDDDDLSEGLQ
jgi:hypothetical protein